MCSHDHHQHDDYMLCPQCDLMVELPRLSHGQKAVCPRCKTALTSKQAEPRNRPLGYAFSALFMLLVANLFPFVNMRVAGITSEITLGEIPKVMAAEDYVSVATLFMLFVQLVPALSMLTVILLCLHASLPLPLKKIMGKALFLLKSWGMAEIFLAGVLVSFVKLMAYGDIGIGTSFMPFMLFCVLQLLAFQSLDRRWLWNDIAPPPALPALPRTGDSGLSQGLRSCPCCTAILPADQRVCPRCRSRGYARRKHSLQWTMALLITSIMLYIPSNLMPIMVTESLGNQTGSTIMAGVILLWGTGSYPVAMVIFIASIMVPTLKMVALGWLCWSTHGREKRDRERLHVVYEIVEFVGRWSMIDVFVIAVLSALVRIGRLMSIYPAIGAVLFASVVILTMVAAMTFDPRLLWDRREVFHKESSVDER
ncbi:MULTISPECIES: membrane integrity-associated transporter subunit PqiA [unclassified Brenneria]|uniref:membrane integrity-associated transporter subunit PqiA n=1 Tax=unclassified Brenneria TaxID=2634434 RepID=UPI0029C5490D|nr:MULTISPECIES: membrane integrity-associated transporter subunit PqiA [unclassified Brenneria]MDX5626594.1 membrane integrity-associated transporter subunit PqiA [Brenneria sp. L3-3Z]MDX5694056.1 membrane integrity-associated transporter subunit PqiA [Brenneria sp. L4-2C]MEE3662710.1 membrane integrity-associated transporter subunit PqiA [Brenneria sp. g21c3]